MAFNVNTRSSFKLNKKKFLVQNDLLLLRNKFQQNEISFKCLSIIQETNKKSTFRIYWENVYIGNWFKSKRRVWERKILLHFWITSFLHLICKLIILPKPNVRKELRIYSKSAHRMSIQFSIYNDLPFAVWHQQQMKMNQKKKL